MWIDRLIGERIRTRCVERGVSLETIAKRTHIDLAILRAYESGRRRIQRRDLIKIARAFHLTPEGLLDGGDTGPSRGFPRVTAQRDFVRISYASYGAPRNSR